MAEGSDNGSGASSLPQGFETGTISSSLFHLSVMSTEDPLHVRCVCCYLADDGEGRRRTTVTSHVEVSLSPKCHIECCLLRLLFH